MLSWVLTMLCCMLTCDLCCSPKRVFNLCFVSAQAMHALCTSRGTRALDWALLTYQLMTGALQAVATGTTITTSPTRCTDGQVLCAALQIMARLSGWYNLHKLLLVLHSSRKSRTVASLRLWYCDQPVSDLQQLKQQGPPTLKTSPAGATDAAAAAAGGAPPTSSGRAQPVWQLAAGGVTLSPGQSEVTVAFELPLVAQALMVEFAGFHVSVNDLAAEVLHCPRCSHVVTDKHGLCSYCR